jgi:uncharacterized damage-inducible protein DinB
MNKTYSKLFLELDEAVNVFLDEVDKKQLGEMTTGTWTVKDVLGHICIWHEYYAQQYEALVKGDEPFVHRSLAGKNEEGRVKMKNISKLRLIDRLKGAQESLRNSIVVHEIPSMRYMRRREYTTGDFLEIVIGHIKRHTIQVRRAK